VFLVNHQPIAAMRRMGEGWLHNVAQGAQCEAVEDADVLDIATQASIALDIAYCGVDVIRDENGHLLVLEVNSIPAWRGLQTVTTVNVAQLLVDGLLGQLNE
jgi:glutathione synthase/RimK-type ligase-like ATP-grasp enzyme